MHQAYITKYIRLNKGAKYALYQDDQPLEVHSFPVHRSGGTDAVFIGIINAMRAAIKRGADELLVYVANEHVIWCIEHPAAVRSPQTITYLMNINTLGQEIKASFIHYDFDAIAQRVRIAREVLHGAGQEWVKITRK